MHTQARIHIHSSPSKYIARKYEYEIFFGLFRLLVDGDLLRDNGWSRKSECDSNIRTRIPIPFE